MVERDPIHTIPALVHYLVVIAILFVTLSVFMWYAGYSADSSITGRVVGGSTVFRSFSTDAIQSGEAVTVTLTIDTIADEKSYILTETIPAGWTVVDAGDGDYKGTNIKWLLIEGFTPGVVVEDSKKNYTLKAPEAPGAGVFSGTYIFEGMTQTVATLGSSVIQVGTSASPLPSDDVQGNARDEQASSPVEPSGTFSPPMQLSMPAIEPIQGPPAPSKLSAPVPASEPYVPPAPEQAFAAAETVPDYTVPPPVAPPAPVPEQPDVAPVVPQVSPVPVETGIAETTETAINAEPFVASPDVFVPETAAPAEQPAPSLPDVSAPSKKSSWLLILLGVAALGGLIAGGIYLKHHPLHNAAAGAGGSFSPQSVKYYIDQYAKLGYQKEQIIAHLVKNGMPQQLVEQVYAEMEQPVAKAG